VFFNIGNTVKDYQMKQLATILGDILHPLPYCAMNCFLPRKTDHNDCIYPEDKKKILAQIKTAFRIVGTARIACRGHQKQT